MEEEREGDSEAADGQAGTAAWKAYDINNDGMIDLAEFEVLIKHATNDGVQKKEVAEAFAVLDLDGNGFLEADELGELIEAMERITREWRLGDLQARDATNPLGAVAQPGTVHAI